MNIRKAATSDSQHPTQNIQSHWLAPFFLVRCWKFDVQRSLFRTVLLLVWFLAFPAQAHVGSPDVFFEGKIGPYPAHVTIRMPNVVPGRAEILVRSDTNTPVEVSFRPLYAGSAVSNAPPADVGKPVPGEANLYTGDLWLMTFGGYSIEVNIRGAAGEGSVEIPVNSIALKQMAMPRAMAIILSALGLLLVVGGAAIVMAAARDSGLLPGVLAGERERRKGWIAGSVTLLVVTLALVGGAFWWRLDEKDFRDQLRKTDAPKLTAKVRVDGSQRILRLTLGKKSSNPDDMLRLLPDHDKLIHLFLIREGARDAFAHLHPIRKAGANFEVALPPLPAGRYNIFCDMTLENSGLSTTSTNTVALPAPIAVTENASLQHTTNSLDADPDDSWACSPASILPPIGTATNDIFQLPNGLHVVWKSHGPLRARQDAGLQFEVLDADGKPVQLEPYMGMMSHAAVLRSDNGVFAHLHPDGNYSMAAQHFYEGKLDREAVLCAPQNAQLPANAGNATAIHGARIFSSGTSTVSLPYEFPGAGNYRIWLQIKTGGQVQTAVFDANVEG